jgi:hypothetical protein
MKGQVVKPMVFVQGIEAFLRWTLKKNGIYQVLLLFFLLVFFMILHLCTLHVILSRCRAGIICYLDDSVVYSMSRHRGWSCLG